MAASIAGWPAQEARGEEQRTRLVDDDLDIGAVARVRTVKRRDVGDHLAVAAVDEAVTRRYVDDGLSGLGDAAALGADRDPGDRAQVRHVLDLTFGHKPHRRVESEPGHAQQQGKAERGEHQSAARFVVAQPLGQPAAGGRQVPRKGPFAYPGHVSSYPHFHCRSSSPDEPPPAVEPRRRVRSLMPGHLMPRHRKVNI
jgi:hypothetical protein